MEQRVMLAVSMEVDPLACRVVWEQVEQEQGDGRMDSDKHLQKGSPLTFPLSFRHSPTQR